MNIPLALIEPSTSSGLLPILMWCLVVLYLYFCVRVTISVVRSIRGIAAPLWVAVCWIIPVIGPVAASVAVRQRHASVNPQT